MSNTFNWKAAIWAGIVAGIVFIMLEMAMFAFIEGMSPWAPPRMMAAIVMGEGVLPPMEGPVTFDFGVVMVAMIVHIVLSIVLAAILGFGISRLGLSLVAAIGGGAIFGVAVYFVNFYGLTALFPWFAMARGMISIFAHAVFGAVAAGVYQVIAGSDTTVGETAATERGDNAKLR